MAAHQRAVAAAVARIRAGEVCKVMLARDLVASVDLREPVRAVREIRRCIDDLGFVAVRVVPWVWDLPPDDRRYYPVYVACVEASVPFCTQIGHTGPLCPSEPGRPIPYLGPQVLPRRQRCPHLPAHPGGGDTCRRVRQRSPTDTVNEKR